MNDRTALPDAATERRIENLELKTMDLENTIQQLNEVVLRQYRDIEQLQRKHTELVNRLQGAAEPAANPTAGDEVPPHY